MIALVDYDAGNVRSVEKAIVHLGAEPVLTRDIDTIRQADHVIVPGVGAFEDAMGRLQNYGLVEPLREIAAEGKPIMGICLGHQLLALACGAKTGRLKFGHHGCNHPVKNLQTGKVEITSQNHNFAVLPESVPDCLEVTHVNLNDGSIEGVRHKTLPAFSVQYHPEACPGPHDSHYLFSEFQKLCYNYQIQLGNMTNAGLGPPTPHE